jgi:hypothetical protein
VANYYTQTSFSIELRSKAEADWWRGYKDALPKEPEERAGTQYDWVNDILEDGTGWGGVEIRVDDSDVSTKKAVYISDDGGTPDLEFLEKSIQRFLKEHGRKDLVVFTWAETCDKAREGAFGGGITAITADCIKCVGTEDLKLRVVDVFEKWREIDFNER